MELVIKYAWFWLGPLIALEAQAMRLWSGRLVTKGNISHSQLIRYINAFTLICLIVSLTMGALQFAGGFDSPFAIYCRPQRNIWLLASWLFVISSWILLLWWLWFGNGANVMLAFSSLAPYYWPRSPKGLRYFLSGLLVFGGPVLFWAATVDFFNMCGRVFGSLHLSG